MKLNIQQFTLGLLVLAACVILLLWSVSLYALHQGEASTNGASFFEVWKQQLVWAIPAIVALVAAVYFALTAAIIRPLLILLNRLKQVMAVRQNGPSRENELLPRLKLLDNYFGQLIDMTRHDPLTGLYNRVMFEERLQQSLMDGKRSGRKFALVIIDINQLQRVNHEMGPYIGDGLLKQMAQRLTSGLRETDSVARLEKDNFALMLEFSELQQITALVNKIYENVIRSYTVYGREVNINVSIGVAIYPEHAQSINDLYLKTDVALVEAQQGDWPVVFADQSRGEPDSSGFSMIQSLRQALDKNEFTLVYQPVMDLKDFSTHYFEALLRWKDPHSQNHSIEQTVALAEKSQLIKPLTNWIINSACEQLKTVSLPSFKVAINLSMIDLHDESLPHRIGQALGDFDVAPAKLLLEITEGQIMSDPDQVIQILNQLSDMGMSLSIDDFGTGQASLTYLKKLPVEKIKIDQSFVKDMVSNAEDRAIVEATINLAHTLGIDVVAEGVESAEIYELLLNMGCDYVQGYYISRPIQQGQIISWCNQHLARIVS
jgi:diguanylate cyclase (GGDEF)-like protein